MLDLLHFPKLPSQRSCTSTTHTCSHARSTRRYGGGDVAAGLTQQHWKAIGVGIDGQLRSQSSREKYDTKLMSSQVEVQTNGKDRKEERQGREKRRGVDWIGIDGLERNV